MFEALTQLDFYCMTTMMAVILSLKKRKKNYRTDTSVNG